MLNKDVKNMANRSENMKKLNKIRSAEVVAMLDLLVDLDKGNGGDIGGFDSFGITDYKLMRGRINSYRAMKIANHLGKNINKNRLLEFKKDKDLLRINDLADSSNNKKVSIDEFLKENSDALNLYYSILKNSYLNNAHSG